MKCLVVLLLLIAANASAEIYTWKDVKGTTFYTNSLDEIPARYRSRAKLLDVASGKKFPLDKAPQPAPPVAGSASAAAAPAPPVSPPTPAAGASQAPATPGQAPPAIGGPAQNSPNGAPQPVPIRRRRPPNQAPN